MNMRVTKGPQRVGSIQVWDLDAVLAVAMVDELPVAQRSISDGIDLEDVGGEAARQVGRHA